MPEQDGEGKLGGGRASDGDDVEGGGGGVDTGVEGGAKTAADAVAANSVAGAGGDGDAEAGFGGGGGGAKGEHGFEAEAVTGGTDTREIGATP